MDGTSLLLVVFVLLTPFLFVVLLVIFQELKAIHHELKRMNDREEPK